MITRFKAAVAVVKSRDMHWGLLAQKDHKDINLSSLRMILVADGANPWSLSSCDAFLNVFQTKGEKQKRKDRERRWPALRLLLLLLPLTLEKWEAAMVTA